MYVYVIVWKYAAETSFFVKAGDLQTNPGVPPTPMKLLQVSHGPVQMLFGIQITLTNSLNLSSSHPTDCTKCPSLRSLYSTPGGGKNGSLTCWNIAAGLTLQKHIVLVEGATIVVNYGMEAEMILYQY